MKRNLIISSGLFLFAVSILMAPSTRAPEDAVPLTASFFSMSAQQKEQHHKSYRELLEFYIEEEHDLEAALDTLESIPTGEVSAEVIRLYEARIAARSLDLQTAETLLKNIDSPEIGLLKAVVLIAQKKRDEAQQYLYFLTNEHPSGEVRGKALSLINAYHTYDKHREAHESYLWTLLAQKLESLGEWELSGYLAGKVIEESPQYRDGWIIKGINEIHLKDFSSAELSLLRAYELDPGNSSIQYLLGVTYHELQDYDQSTQYLTYSQKNSKKNTLETLQLLGDNAQLQEQYSLASHYFEQVLQQQPQHPQTLLKLSWLLVKHLDQPERALELAQRYYTIVGKTAESAQLLSWINGKLGNLEDALNILENH